MFIISPSYCSRENAVFYFFYMKRYITEYVKNAINTEIIYKYKNILCIASLCENNMICFICVD